MNKIVADGVDRHHVNVEERRIMIDKNIMKKRQGTLGRGFDRCDFFIGINDFVREIEKFFASPLDKPDFM